MKAFIVFLLLAVLIDTHFQRNTGQQIPKLRRRIHHFKSETGDTLHILHNLKREINSTCISTSAKGVNQKSKRLYTIQQFIKNTRLLEALIGFTDDILFVTPRIHRRLRRNKHEARALLYLHRKIYRIPHHEVNVTVKDQKCNQINSMELLKSLIEVYDNFQRLVDFLC